MLSFIFPSNDYNKASRLVAHLNTKFPEAEVKPVFNAIGFFDAWRKGLVETSGDILIFTHHDVEFMEIPDLEMYLKGNVGMIGPAGGTEITRDVPWWFDVGRLREGKLSGKIWHKDGENVYGPYGEVKVLDGVCLITKREILERVGIPNLKGVDWHFYDHVLAYEYAKKGFNLQTVPIKVRHESTGGKGEEFLTALGVFKEIYL